MALEKLNFNIPEGCEWNTEDVEKRAESLGFKNKSELMVKAVDMMINFDLDFYKTIQRYAEGLKIPEYIVIQNMIINQLAQRAAKKLVYGDASEILIEFTSKTDANGDFTMITGDELLRVLTDKYQRDYQAEKVNNDTKHLK